MCAVLTLTRGKTLPDSGVKKDLHDLIDLATGTISGIVNADVHASAAIAGSKIAPNFGSQTVICGDCNVTDEFQLNGSAGTAGQVVTSAGDGEDTVWATPSAFAYDGTEVYSGTPAATNTWYDLDLSSYVGSNRALVLVKVEVTGTTSTSIIFRENGESDWFGNTESANGGAPENGYATSSIYLMCVTDSSGVVEWSIGTSSERTGTKIQIMCYVK